MSVLRRLPDPYPYFRGIVAELGFRYTIPMREGLARWYRSLADAGRIEDSDGDPLDDRLIKAWGRVTEGGALAGSVEAS